MEKIHEQHKINREIAEHQMKNSHRDWQNKYFWQSCYPLNNVYETPGYDISKKEVNLKLQTIKNEKGETLVALKLIAAVEKTHPHFDIINNRLSNFMRLNYSSNGTHGVVADMGSWKENFPVNSSSIQNLFDCLKGQPIMLLRPHLTGNILTVSIDYWGLGEKLNTPKTFAYEGFDLDLITKKALAEEVQLYWNEFKNAGEKPDSSELKKDLEILDFVSKKLAEGKLTETMLKIKWSGLVYPNEYIKNAVKKRVNDIIFAIYACTTSIYADIYYLEEYGSLPVLPSILHTISGAKALFSLVAGFYISIIKEFLGKSIITPENSLKISEDLLNSAVQLKVSPEVIKRLKRNTEILKGINAEKKPSFNKMNTGIIKFGKYPYEEDGTKKPLEWLVLNKDADGTMLLMSKYIVDVLEYNNKSSGNLRKWLKDTFYDQAFNESEKKLIKNSYSSNRSNIKNNPYIEEVFSFLNTNPDVSQFATPYAAKRGATGVSESWILRSPGVNSDLAAFIMHVSSGHYAVRIALRINPRK